MQLDVREQARLPFRRLLSICLDSIRYRLLRSMVTVFIILVAIAFLANILVEGELGRATRDSVRQRTQVITAFARFLRQISQVPSAEQLLDLAAGARPTDADYANLAAWGD